MGIATLTRLENFVDGATVGPAEGRTEEVLYALEDYTQIKHVMVNLD